MKPLKIEKNIPIPKKDIKKISWKDIAEEMKVGDSVLICGNDEKKALCKKQALKNAMRYLGQRPIERQVKRGDRTRYRVWRVA